MSWSSRTKIFGFAWNGEALDAAKTRDTKKLAKKMSDANNIFTANVNITTGYDEEKRKETVFILLYLLILTSSKDTIYPGLSSIIYDL